MRRVLQIFRRGKNQNQNQNINKQPSNPEQNKEKVLDCIARNDFSRLGIDLQLIEDVFYRGLEAGIVKIIPSADGGIRVSITNLEIETFPIQVERKELLKYFYYDD